MKELRMLCAEDEQGRTCWMTAFRLFKVTQCLKAVYHAAFVLPHKRNGIYAKGQLPPFPSYNMLTEAVGSVGSPACFCFSTVWHRIVPELQDSSTEKNFTLTLLSPGGKFDPVKYLYLCC